VSNDDPLSEAGEMLLDIILSDDHQQAGIDRAKVAFG
jgi:hypothetical protein